MNNLFIDEQQYYVFLDALLYVLTCVYFIWKKRTINAGIFILIIMTISHIGAIFYYSVLCNLGFNINITIAPFVYLYLMIMLSIYPLIKYDEIEKIDVGINKRFITIFTYLVFFISIPPLLENISILISNGGNMDYGSVYADKMDGKLEIYSSISETLMRWSNYFRIIIFGIFFYALLLPKNQRDYKQLFAQISCIINYILYAINTSSRAMLLTYMLISVCSILLLKKCFSSIMLKKVKRIVLILGGVFLLFMILITISRYNEKSKRSIYEWVLLYVSEGPIKFNNEMWDANHNTNGDVNITLLKYYLGDNTYMTYQDRDEYYMMKNGRRIEVFYTFVGDFLSDFDYIGAALCCLMLLLLEIKLFYKKKTISFESYITICFLLQLFSIGFASNIFRSVSMQKGAFYTFIFIVFLFIYRHWQKRVTFNKVIK